MTSTIRPRPGGRSARVRAAVLSATTEALTAQGLSGLTIADVAERAGVHETTIYRRWATRERLVLDALLARSAELIQTPDTGSIRGDLIQLGQEIVDYGNSPIGEAFTRTMATVADDDESAEMRRQFWDTRHETVEILTERAKARGELPAHVQSRQLVEVFISPIHFRLLLTHEPTDREFLTELADIAVNGVSALGIERSIDAAPSRT